MAPDQTLHKGDIAHTTDYRAVYAPLLEKHMGVDFKPVPLQEITPLTIL